MKVLIVQPFCRKCNAVSAAGWISQIIMLSSPTAEVILLDAQQGGKTHLTV